MADGNCFEVAARIVLKMVDQAEPREREDVEAGLEHMVAAEEGWSDALGKLKETRLMHGVVKRSQDGFMHLHAWVEMDFPSVTMCLDFANGKRYLLPKDTFYNAGVCLTTQYTPRQVCEMLTEHETWGPWHLKEPTQGGNDELTSHP